MKLISVRYDFCFSRSILLITIKHCLSKDLIYFNISIVLFIFGLTAFTNNNTKSLSNIALEACLNVLLEILSLLPKIPGVSKKINCLFSKVKTSDFCLIVV